MGCTLLRFTIVGLNVKTLQIIYLQGFASVRATWRREGDSNP